MKVPVMFSQYVFENMFSTYFDHSFGLNEDEIIFVAKIKGLAVHSNCRVCNHWDSFVYFFGVQIHIM